MISLSRNSLLNLLTKQCTLKNASNTTINEIDNINNKEAGDALKILIS